MRLSELIVVPFLAAAVEARACKAKPPKSSSISAAAVLTTFSAYPVSSFAASATDASSIALTTSVPSNETTTAASSSSEEPLTSASATSAKASTTEPPSTFSTVSSTSSAAVESSTFSTVVAASSEASSTVVSITTSSAETTSAVAETTSAAAETTSVAAETSTSAAETTSTSAAQSTSTAASTTTASNTSPTSTPFRLYPADSVDKLRDASIPKLDAFSKRSAAGSCTMENAVVRKEWSDLSVPEREEYIAAVKCLQALPNKTPNSVAPGARSRYDDIVVPHIQQTMSIHNTANFLSWHRYYVWAHEQALRNECGYKGFQPYWNWDRYAADPVNSPLFNGNASSISGNSPSQGACINTGPFKDMKVNMGPGNSLRYNPRCIKRNISKQEATATVAARTLALIQQSSTVGRFQDVMQAVPGVHAAGHFTVGGDPGGDIYTSPGDPYFFLHHAMIDRVWWIWQMQDLDSRLTAVSGSAAGGRQGSLNDDVNLGLEGPSVKLGSLLNTMGGKGGDFCYIYA